MQADRKLSQIDNSELFSEKEIDATYERVQNVTGISLTIPSTGAEEDYRLIEDNKNQFRIKKKEIKREATATDILHILQDYRRIFPFIAGDVPLVALVCISILSYRYAEKLRISSLTDLSKIFKLLCVPVERWGDEAVMLHAYSKASDSYLLLAEDPETGSEVIVLSKKAFLDVFNMAVKEEIPEYLSCQITSEKGFSPIVRSMVKARERKTRRQEQMKELSTLRLKDIVVDDEETRFKLEYLAAFAKKKGQTFRLLLHGLPGTGKTHCARCLSGEIQKPLITVSYSQILSKWVSECEKELTNAFEQAKAQDAILFLDEVDSILTQRTTSSRSWENSSVNTLLMLLDKRDTNVILASNFPEILDSALRRRVEETIEFLPPKAPARKEIWKKELERHGLGITGLDLDELSTIPLSGGLIFNAVRKAHMRKTVMGKGFEQNTEAFKSLALEESLKMEKNFACPKKAIGFGS
jgi:SpoVK/Ycf46/Vps4 family AAA+-type ATPase